MAGGSREFNSRVARNLGPTTKLVARTLAGACNAERMFMFFIDAPHTCVNGPRNVLSYWQRVFVVIASASSKVGLGAPWSREHVRPSRKYFAWDQFAFCLFVAVHLR